MTGAEHLAWLRTRRSVRAFADRPVDTATLERVLEAATTAPSSTNRQPWRFAVVTSAKLRGSIAEAVRARTAAIEDVVAGGPHAEDFGSYGDFFWEPLAGAAAIVIPQTRTHPDLLANFIRSAGGDADAYPLPGAMDPELCAASAAVMTLLLQAHAEGLGAVWMAGPMVARPEIEDLLEIRAPWRMVGGIALGHRAGEAKSAPKRKPLARVVRWFGDEQ
jgi:nitroreductase